METQGTEKLIAAIVTWIADQDSYVTKTKLLKLLYLFDVEYYRVHRQTFTGFSWKFFHLGPWAAEFDPTLDGLVSRDVLIQQLSTSEHETSFYKPYERMDPREPFGNVKDECILRGVLNTWGTQSTGEILDYVYFQTAPMEAGIRNAPLDFSVIQPEKPPAYSRSSSGKTKAEVQKFRTKFEAQQAQRKASQNQAFVFTPPKYDEGYLNAMAKLETA
ncbi:MAG: hypothetical protein ACLQBJ_01810 [Bryobacteraceae bacterium]